MSKHLKSQSMNNKKNGFTLIEVMVATVILISSVAAMSMVYRGAFLSSDKADKHINITGVLPSVLAVIRDEVRQLGNSDLERLSGQGSAWDVRYQWSATLVDFQSAPEKFDSESESFIVPDKKYKLWQVELTLERNSLIKDYVFKELSWNDT